ncbi:sulfatase [Tichowtungia aerotolerans]|uniref:Sulfatase-like hydrolase/transferase n=1 Tax=Tichowtungia aerotolerans TaxID=2697043 RepID=A0A6P1MAY7_9BACT|nr:sulfatase [Tichowtungia aerotolerans]QHI68716.1 sulfatase-like hydrolase/transferase [Tichowtungia aerotolerans]
MENFFKMVFCLTMTLCTTAFSTDEKQTQRLNVLYLMADDMNSYVGFITGSSLKAQTPNLDRLAAMGVIFDQAQVACPICNPSRIAALSGIAPHHSGVYFLHQLGRDAPRLKDHVFLPQYFRRHGYRTEASGKIFHGWEPQHIWSDDTPGHDLSWDHVCPKYSWLKPLGADSGKYATGTAAGGIDGVWSEYAAMALDKKSDLMASGRAACVSTGDTVQDEDMADYKQAQDIARRLADEHTEPFFLAYGCFRPHAPWYVPKKYLDMYPLESIELPAAPLNDMDDIPSYAIKNFANDPALVAACDPEKYVGAKNFFRDILQKDPEAWKRFVQAYLASITFSDHCLGLVIDAWQNSAYRDNTIVSFWSDHGFHWGEKQHTRKWTLWDNATRTPFIIVGPGIRPGRVCKTPVSILDLYPTLVELAGLPKKVDIDGHSLAPLLQDVHASWPQPAVTTTSPGNSSVRFGKYKYIRYADKSEELYDMSQDPREYTNLAANPEYAELIRNMKTHLPNKYASEHF